MASNPNTSNKSTTTFNNTSEPFPWPGASGFQGGEVPVSEERRAAERNRVAKWTVEDVKAHMTSLGCPEQAKLFAEEVCIFLCGFNEKNSTYSHTGTKHLFGNV